MLRLSLHRISIGHNFAPRQLVLHKRPMRLDTEPWRPACFRNIPEARMAAQVELTIANDEPGIGLTVLL